MTAVYADFMMMSRTRTWVWKPVKAWCW